MAEAGVGNSDRGQDHGWVSEDTWRQKAHSSGFSTKII